VFVFITEEIRNRNIHTQTHQTG